MRRLHIWLLNEHENLQFDNESDISMSSKNVEESGYVLHLELLTISYYLHVSYPEEVGYLEKMTILDPSTLQALLIPILKDTLILRGNKYTIRCFVVHLFLMPNHNFHVQSKWVLAVDVRNNYLSKIGVGSTLWYNVQSWSPHMHFKVKCTKINALHVFFFKNFFQSFMCVFLNINL